MGVACVFDRQQGGRGLCVWLTVVWAWPLCLTDSSVGVACMFDCQQRGRGCVFDRQLGGRGLCVWLTVVWALGLCSSVGVACVFARQRCGRGLCVWRTAVQVSESGEGSWLDGSQQGIRHRGVDAEAAQLPRWGRDEGHHQHEGESPSPLALPSPLSSPDAIWPHLSPAPLLSSPAPLKPRPPSSPTHLGHRLSPAPPLSSPTSLQPCPSQTPPACTSECRLLLEIYFDT